MRLDFRGERVLAVVAHPDDADLLCSGTLARARDDGAAIGICILCRGDKGQPSKPLANLAAVRKKEAMAGARLLRAQIFFGGVPDGALYDNEASRWKLVEIYRRFKPTLVLAHSPEDYHADHRATAALAEAVSWFCASRGHKTNSQPMAAPPALWWIDTINMNGFLAEFYVDVSRYMALKAQMLACHKSQLQRGSDADFSPLIELMRAQSEARGRQAGVAAAEAFRALHAFKRARAW